MGTSSSRKEQYPSLYPQRNVQHVQIKSEPMNAEGMSAADLFASCAAVLTASNPM